MTTTIAANAAANTTQLVDLQTSPEVGKVQTIQIPSKQTWLMLDLFILVSADAGTSDPQLRIVKDQNKVLYQSPNLSTLLVSNNSRPKFEPKLGFEENSQFQVYAITTVANDATADNIKAFAIVDRRL